MKQRLPLMAVMAMFLIPAGAQQKYETGKPNDANYSYLKDYHPLKDYINYEKYPNFKLGIGTTVSEYLKANSMVQGLTNDNFTETVAGNAMKMSSCVDSNGNMNFGTVTKYVNAATEAGLNVYGHTLAWHSQQANNWLRSLIKDKPAPSTEPREVTEDRRCIVVNATARVNYEYDNQFWLVTGDFAAGASFEFSADVRADKAASASTQIHTKPGEYVHYEALGSVSFTTEWRTITAKGKFSQAGASIAFNLNDFAEANNYYFDNLSLKINGVEMLKNGNCEEADVSSFKKKLAAGAVVAANISESIKYTVTPSPIPLTQEEKRVILAEAMEKWIKGMMDACGGKVKAWDVVNEAISGGGDDGEGNYALQHSAGFDPETATWDVGGESFYWQDHMGDLEYVRTAISLARKHGPEDVKLFINDYNLESDWDQNKKVKSLINWIKKWEADGVTKVDGIGTQMHISYYENSGTLSSKKKAITNMFTLMAATGKLVRVSELDMGYFNSSNKALKTTELTETQQKNMADYYEWVIKEYLRLIPAEQQWGICQWCPTDAPTNSSWRGGEPVGIWDLNYYRKHVYAGFVKGLGGEVYNAIEQVVAERQVSADAIYDIRGNMYPVGTSLQNLPSGIYIIGDRKIKK